jgi:hypothetical protein
MKRMNIRTTAPLLALAILLTTPLFSQERFSHWGPAERVQGAPGVNINTNAGDTHPVLSRDGLSLYFLATNTRSPNYGGRDIWYATRSSLLAAWDDPRNAGCAVNSAYLEEGAMLTPDNHHLYFASTRPGDGFGGFDIYVSDRRQTNADPVCSEDQGWNYPVNLGGGVNTAVNETSPAFFEDDSTGVVYLYFARASAATPTIYDIYVSTLQADGTFGVAEPVTAVNSTFNEDGPFISKTGLELYFNSMRTGFSGRGDLFVSHRASTNEAWSAPDNLNANCDYLISNPQACPNTGGNEVGPVLSWDGTELYFGAANRYGNVTPDYDLWVVRRSKVTGKPIY